MPFFPLFASALTGASFDPDAAAFFTAAAITDPTQKTAVNQLVLDLKAASLWSNVTALYPFVGGTASQHSYNLKNPATFQITWNGTVTHNANGITGNGTTGYGATGITPSTHLSQNSIHGIVYSRTALTASARHFGCASTTGGTSLFNIFSNGGAWNGQANDNTPALTGTLLFTRFNANTRTGASAVGMQQDTSYVASVTSSVVAVSQPLLLLARSFEGFGNDSFSNGNLALASFGAGYTQAQLANYKTAVDLFQLTLGRNV